MKKQLFTSLVLLLFSVAVYGQADNIIGFWLTEDGDSQVEVYKRADGKYYGRVVWLEEPLNDAGKPKVDDKNPDKAMHNTPIIGLVILKDFSYNASKNEWSGGTIYDPKNGRTYSAYMTLDGSTLRMRGFVYGMRFLGRSSYWTRERELRGSGK